MKQKAITIVGILVLGFLYWKFPHLFEGNEPQPGQEQAGKPAGYRTDQEGLVGDDVPTADVEKEGDYAVFQGCTLVDRQGNDGDSFWVRFPNGAERQIRLYYVDAPESSFKTYRSGDTNGTRIGHQGRYFGDLSIDETTGVGKDATKFVEKILGRGEFTILTKFKAVFESGRIFAFVRTGEGYLHEELVRQGLVRIYTEGDEMPDGTSRSAQTRRLKDMESQAKRERLGGWGK